MTSVTLQVSRTGISYFGPRPPVGVAGKAAQAVLVQVKPSKTGTEPPVATANYRHLSGVVPATPAIIVLYASVILVLLLLLN